MEPMNRTVHTVHHAALTVSSVTMDSDVYQSVGSAMAKANVVMVLMNQAAHKEV